MTWKYLSSTLISHTQHSPQQPWVKVGRSNHLSQAGSTGPLVTGRRGSAVLSMYITNSLQATEERSVLSSFWISSSKSLISWCNRFNSAWRRWRPRISLGGGRGSGGGRSLRTTGDRADWIMLKGTEGRLGLRMKQASEEEKEEEEEERRRKSWCHRL